MKTPRQRQIEALLRPTTQDQTGKALFIATRMMAVLPLILVGGALTTLGVVLPAHAVVVVGVVFTIAAAAGLFYTFWQVR